MAEVTANLVSALRAATGLGMMECKQALVEKGGDLKEAEALLRIKSGAKAGKFAGRIAAEGVIATFIRADGHVGAMVEVNCETDFVAKDSTFTGLALAVAEGIATANPTTLEEVMALAPSSQQTIEEMRKEAIAKLGENLTIRRFVRFETAGKIAVYIHGSRLGVLVDYQPSSAGITDGQLGKDVAMHIAASLPICVSKDQISADLLENERKIYTAQASQSGKPSEIIEKMVEGRVAKYLAEVTLMGQAFVKNPEMTVEQLLAKHQSRVNAFQVFKVGEGIEKSKVDFATEVAAVSKL